MKIVFYTVAFALVLLYGCGSNSTSPTPSDSFPKRILPSEIQIQLTGTVCVFGEIITDTCGIQFGVDSGEEIIFDSDSTFIKIDYFSMEESVFIGNYKWKNDTCYLNTDSVSVTRSSDFVFKNNGKSSQAFVYSSKNNLEITPHQPVNKFVIENCGKKNYIKIIGGDKNFPSSMVFGAFPEKATIEKEIAQLKKDSIWEMLQK